MFSGSGCFEKFVHRIGRKPDARFHHCVHCRRDTAKYLLAECTNLEEPRRALVSKVGNDLSLSALIRSKVGSTASEAVMSFCVNVTSDHIRPEVVARIDPRAPQRMPGELNTSLSQLDHKALVGGRGAPVAHGASLRGNTR